MNRCFLSCNFFRWIAGFLLISCLLVSCSGEERSRDKVCCWWIRFYVSDDLFFYCNVGLRGLRSDKVHCLKEVSGLYHQWGDKERYSYLFALKQKGTQVYWQYTKSISRNQLNQSNSYVLSQLIWIGIFRFPGRSGQGTRLSNKFKKGHLPIFCGSFWANWGNLILTQKKIWSCLFFLET